MGVEIMRTKDMLFELEDITILLQYLYMDESNFIKIPPFNNEMYMDENFYMKLKVVSTGITVSYDDSISVNSLLGIIDYLKDTEYDVELHQLRNCGFRTEWDYIKTVTLANVGQNKIFYKDRK